MNSEEPCHRKSRFAESEIEGDSSSSRSVVWPFAANLPITQIGTTSIGSVAYVSHIDFIVFGDRHLTPTQKVLSLKSQINFWRRRLEADSLMYISPLLLISKATGLL